MIAIFLEDLPRGRALASRFFESKRDVVDGPFRAFDGRIRGERARLWVVNDRADAAYAAARLAIRRGAQSLIPMTEATSPGPETAVPGDVLPAGAVWDLAGLEPLLRLLPDSSPEFPIDPAALLPASALWNAESGAPGLGTPPFDVRNIHLAEWLSGRGIHLLDRQAAGYAAAAAETGLPIRPIALVTTLLTPTGPESTFALQIEKTFEEALDLLFSS